MRHLARSLYRWSVFLAMPGGLWIAFELYGLTLRGPQMLFFTIAHAMPFLLVAMFLSVPAGLAWLAQSVVAVASARYGHSTSPRCECMKSWGTRCAPTRLARSLGVLQVHNPSIERTCSSGLRPLPHAAHVKR